MKVDNIVEFKFVLLLDLTIIIRTCLVKKYTTILGSSFAYYFFTKRVKRKQLLTWTHGKSVLRGLDNGWSRENKLKPVPPFSRAMVQGTYYPCS